jgi:hypothetical protein
MEKTFNCILNEDEIKKAIEYWLNTEKGFKIKLPPGQRMERLPMIKIIKELPPGGTSEPIDQINISAICELEIE